MPLPFVPSFARRLYDAFQPLQFQDALNNYSLLYYLGAIGEAYQEVEELAGDGPNGEVGWSIVVDPTRVPDEGLDWLGQFIGARFDPSLTDAQKRVALQSYEGWKRGTPEAIIKATQQYLSGNKTVLLRERDGTAYRLSVIVYNAELVDAVKAEAAARSQKPGGLRLDFLVINGRSYLEVKIQNATYQTVKNNYATYLALRGDTPITGQAPTDALTPSDTLTPT